MADLEREHGVTGTEFVGGVIARPLLSAEVLGDDYLNEWTFETVDRMLRSDGQIAAIWQAIQLAISSAEWDLVPASDSTEDREIADFVAANLWPLWEDYLRQALLYLAYGFMLFEVVYEERGGQIWWAKLAPRLPWTITRWELSGNQLVAVHQTAYSPEGSSYRTFRIPAEKILRLTYGQEGLNFEGRSILRPAFKHWKMKDLLYKVGAIYHERWGVGIPVGTLPPNATPEDEERFVEILSKLRGNEAAYIYLPRGSAIDQCIRILTPERSVRAGDDLVDLIRHHDVLIARSVLAEFIQLGDTQYGSRAVSADQADLFYAGLQGIADYIAHVTNWGRPGENRGIADLVRLNFGEDAGVPELRVGGLRRRDTAEVARILAELVRSMVISPTRDIEAYARSLVGAPEPMKAETPEEARAEHAREGAAEKAAASEPRLKRPHLPSKRGGTYRKAPCDHGGHLRASESGFFWREPYEWERHVPFAEYARAHQSWERRFVRAWQEAFERQLRFIREELGASISRDELPKLAGLELPTGGLAQQIYSLMRQARLHGRRSVFQELLSLASGRVLQSPPRLFQELPEPDESDELLRRWAEESARNLSEKTRRFLQYEAMRRLWAEDDVPTDEVLDEIMDMSEQAATLESYITLRPAWGLGRNEAGAAFADLVRYGYYSAILDDRVCGICEEEDGREVSPGEIATPNPNCQGGARCRCVTVWVLRDEVRPEDVASRWEEVFGEE